MFSVQSHTTMTDTRRAQQQQALHACPMHSRIVDHNVELSFAHGKLQYSKKLSDYWLCMIRTVHEGYFLAGLLQVNIPPYYCFLVIAQCRSNRELGGQRRP
ncbi:hypothetical protein RB213_012677 [Colletotrichum asianum]